MISVVMNTYMESVELIRYSIESILNQTYKDIEFIIVLDNINNINHKAVINEYALKDDRIKFKINTDNPGRVGALNYALSMCKGDYIAIMDADDIALPDRLEKQLDYIKKHDFDLIGGITQIIDETGNAIYSIRKIPTDSDKIKKVLKYGQCIAHPTWLGKRLVFEELKGYRDIPLCEDYDFTLRAVLAGYQISNLNEIVLKYRMTSKSISRSNLYNQYLYMKYITNEYAKGRVANVEEANNYVLCHTSEKKANHYSKANVIFNRMLKEMEEKQLFPFIKDGFQLLFTSRSYLNKIYRFALLTINS